jgi:hypothetical protein
MKVTATTDRFVDLCANCCRRAKIVRFGLPFCQPHCAAVFELQELKIAHGAAGHVCDVVDVGGRLFCRTWSSDGGYRR